LGLRPGTGRWSARRPIFGDMRLLLAVALSAFVSSPGLPQSRAVPTPESVFGFPVGADYKLFGYDASIAYFRRLAAASTRVRLIEVGKTSFGRPWTAVLISSPANLAQLERWRGISRRLAHPQGLTDAEARRLAQGGKVFVDISGGLHASETAGSQHTPQLAYEILSRASEPEMRAVLDNVILFLWPSINPDGQDIVVDWCRARDEGKNPPPMELYQKYIGHDNNRDSYMLSVVESRVIARTWREWEPSIIYVHHQSSPFPTRIWIPPFADPVGLRVPGHHGQAGECHRHADRDRAGREGAAGGRAHARDLRRLVSGLHRLHADVPEHRRLVDGDPGRQLRDAPHLYRR
jgi:hypothetical protein